MKQKGVARAIIDGVLDGLDEKPYCEALAQKYVKGKPLDYATKAKTAAYLTGKGFDWDVVHEVVDGIQSEED